MIRYINRDLIERRIHETMDMQDLYLPIHFIQLMNEQDDVDAVEVVRCKDCKYFELNHVELFNGIPLILAHQICTRWGDGCKTDENGFCFMGEKVTE